MQIYGRGRSVRIQELRIVRDAIGILAGRSLPVGEGQLIASECTHKSTGPRRIEVIEVRGEARTAQRDSVMLACANSVASRVVEDVIEILASTSSNIADKGEGGLCAIHSGATNVNAVVVEVVSPGDFKHAVDLISSRDGGAGRVYTQADHVILVSALTSDGQNTDRLNGGCGRID